MNRIEQLAREIQGNLTKLVTDAERFETRMAKNTKFLEVGTMAILLVFLIQILSIVYFCCRKNKTKVINDYNPTYGNLLA
jgi:hypothetical protein